MKAIKTLVSLAAFCPLLAQADVLETRSTYQCISVYWTRANTGPCTVHYKRDVGETTWNQAQNLYWDNVSNVPGTEVHPAQEGQFRGSIVNLKSGTRHRIRLTIPHEPVKEFLVWTRASNPPTSDDPASGLTTKTIRTGANISFSTTSGGNDAAWQVYDGGGGTIANTEGGPNVAINVLHNKVIIRNIKISGARKNALVIASGVSDVIIDNCDIWNWGRSQATANNENGDQPDYHFGAVAPGDVAIGAQDFAVVAIGARRVTIQNCKIHHPRYRAAVWHEFSNIRTGHPHGPVALITGVRDEATGTGAWEGNHVIRFNEFYSDAKKPFEDILGLGENFSQAGFPGPDSDIHGNIFRHAADDAIEADGGNCNVRIWGNYFDATYSRLSHQSLSIGPAYFFRNVIARGYGPVLSAIRSVKPGWMPPAGFDVSYEMLKLKSLRSPVDAQNNPTQKGLHFHGPFYVYHNTSLASDATGIKEVMNLYDTGGNKPPAEDVERVHLCNNLWVTTASYIRDDSPTQSDWVGCTSRRDLHNKPGVFFWVTEDFANLLPHWIVGHGTYPTNDPVGSTAITPRPTGFYQLEMNSPGHDGAAPLPNFNSSLESNPPSSTPPDIGAHATGSAKMQFGVGATWNPIDPDD